MKLEEIKHKIRIYMTFRKYLAIIGLGGIIYVMLGMFTTGLFLILVFLLGLTMLDKYREDLLL